MTYMAADGIVGWAFQSTAADSDRRHGHAAPGAPVSVLRLPQHVRGEGGETCASSEMKNE